MTTLSAAFTAAILGGSLAAASLLAFERDTPAESTTRSATQTSSPQVERMEASWAFERSDLRQLAGASDLLAVVEVTGGGEVRETPAGIVTDFPASVVRSFKGETTRARIELTQEGGLDADSNTLYLFEGDAMLRPGHVYLIAARRDAESGPYTVVPEFGTVDVTQARGNEIGRLTATYEAAVDRQVVPPAVAKAKAGR